MASEEVADSGDKKRKWETVEEKSEGIAVGTHHGGNFHTYMSHKIQKLQELHHCPVEEVISDIFMNCCMYVNGVTHPPLQDIRRLVTMHGGEFAAYKTSRVTHIICDYLTDAQLKQELGKSKIYSMSNHKKIFTVRAKWITDSVAHKVKLSENSYLPEGLKDRFGGNLRNIFKSSEPVLTATANVNSQSKLSNDLPTLAQLTDIDVDIQKNTPSSSISLLVTGAQKRQNSMIMDEIDLVFTPDKVEKYESHKVFEKEGWKVLTKEQREFLDAVPPDLRSEILTELIKESKSNQFFTEGIYHSKLSREGNHEEEIVELLSASDSPMIVNISTNEATDFDDDIIDLASPPTNRMAFLRNDVVDVSATSENDLWDDASLLRTLHEVINYVHFTPSSCRHQKKLIRNWVNAMLDHASFPVIQEKTSNNDSSTNHHTISDEFLNEEQVHWHLRRCWRLLSLYANWLIDENLFEYLQMIQNHLQTHPICKWSSDEEANSWQNVFQPERHHHRELQQWHLHVKARLTHKLGCNF